MKKEKPLIEICPNCKGTDYRESEDISDMPNGQCGVCGGKGVIKWTPLGRLTWTPKYEETKPKTKAQEFADTIKNKHKEIIAWAKREIKEYERLIKEYERLIKILEKRK